MVPCGNGEARKGYKGLGMEGRRSRWYAKNTGQSIEEFRKLACWPVNLQEARASWRLPPGPGYLAIELAKLGSFQVVGLDISKTFVAIAAANARTRVLRWSFSLLTASAMPFGHSV